MVLVLIAQKAVPKLQDEDVAKNLENNETTCVETEHKYLNTYSVQMNATSQKRQYSQFPIYFSPMRFL